MRDAFGREVRKVVGVAHPIDVHGMLSGLEQGVQSFEPASAVFGHMEIVEPQNFDQHFPGIIQRCDLSIGMHPNAGAVGEAARVRDYTV